MPSLEKIPIQIQNPSGEPIPATLEIEQWPENVRTQRAIRQCVGLLKWIGVPAMLAIVVHPLILPTLLTSITAIVTLPYLFSYFKNQKATFTHAEGKCPGCSVDGQLNRYLRNTVEEEFTLLCPNCGQTCRARLVQPQ